MKCCEVTKDDEYLLVCTSEDDTENGKAIKRGRVYCFNIKRK
jgi:hypothetical protein